MARSRSQFRRQVYRFATRSLRRNQHRIHAHAACFLKTKIAEVAGAGAGGLDSISDREIGALLQQIHSKDAATGGLQQLAR